MNIASSLQFLHDVDEWKEVPSLFDHTTLEGNTRSYIPHKTGPWIFVFWTGFPGLWMLKLKHMITGNREFHEDVGQVKVEFEEWQYSAEYNPLLSIFVVCCSLMWNTDGQMFV
ncbi:hypothetical protein ABKN59_001597 [Abortiporus biennis]